jgi:putative flippase GtrA
MPGKLKSSRSALERLARFIGVTAVGFPLNLGITAFVHEVLGGPEEIAFATALVCVFAFNFGACRYVIFRATTGNPRSQLLKYAGMSAVFRLAEYLGFLLVHTVLDVQYLMAAVVVLGTSFFLKFHTYGTFVFTDGRRETT